MSDETDGGMRPPSEGGVWCDHDAKKKPDEADRKIVQAAEAACGMISNLEASIRKLREEKTREVAEWAMSDETDGGIKLPNEGLYDPPGEAELEEVVRKFREDKAREVAERASRDDAARKLFERASRLEGEKAALKAEVGRLRSEVLSRPGHGDAVVMVTTTELLRLNKLEGVVKRVLARKADDVCWRDVYTEMAGLVGVELEPELLERSSFLRNCSHFYDCLAKGEQYHAPPTDDLLRRAASSLCEVIREDGGSLLRGDMARAWLNMEMVLRTGKEL